MNSDEKSVSAKDVKARLSTLWIVVMVNTLAADIFSFMIPGALVEMMTGSTASS